MRLPVISAIRDLFSLSRQMRAQPRAIDNNLIRLLGGENKAQTDITYDSMMKLSAVYRCIRLLSESVAQLPLIMYRRLPGGGRERATDHPLYRLMKEQPHPEMTSFMFRETLQGHLGSWGNAFASIGRSVGGDVIDMLPLRPDRMRLVRGHNNALEYHYRVLAGSPEIVIPNDEILHVRGFSFTGSWGSNPQDDGREIFGTAKAADDHAGNFFANDSTPRGILMLTRLLPDQKSRDRLRSEWEKTYGGIDNKNKTAILEEGTEYKPIGLSPQVTQLLESRRFSVGDIARFYGIPPHMIGDLEKATFSNITEQSIQFVQHTIMPWTIRWEQQINSTLIKESERGEYFFEFLLDALMRGTPDQRASFYNAGRLSGWLNGDEIRARENMNPIPDGKGAAYWQPLNMVPLGETFASVDDDDDDDDETDSVVPGEPRPRAVEHRGDRSAASRSRTAQSFHRVYGDAIARVLKRERADVMKAAEKNLTRGDAEFEAFLVEYYRAGGDLTEFLGVATGSVYAQLNDAVRESIQDEMGVAELGSEFDQAIIDYRENFAGGYASASIGQLRAVVRDAIAAGGDPLDALQLRFDQWQERRPSKMAFEETFRAVNALSLAGYASAGVRRLRWVIGGSTTCPYCTEMNGRIIGIDRSFLPAGGDLTPEGATPMHQYRAVKHPPLHQRCDCMIVAA